MLNISKKLLVAAVVAWSMLMPLGGVVMAQSVTLRHRQPAQAHR